MSTPSRLLLRYFELAQRRLQSSADGLGAEEPPPSSSLDWHRSRIVEAQLVAVEEAVSEWQRENNDATIDAEAVQGALRRIGVGDFSSVSFGGHEEVALPSTTTSTGLRSRASGSSSTGSGQVILKDNSQEQQLLLTEAVERTNELARQVFARSILVSEWRFDESNSQPQSGRELRGTGNVDESSVLQYCGLLMAAVRLPQVLRYLENGTVEFVGDSTRKAIEGVNTSVEDRLLRIQMLYWRALGWEPTHAMAQLNALLSGQSSQSDMFQGNAEAMETLTKYASVMTVAATNAGMSSSGNGDAAKTLNSDGTTRVVSVAYSEKIVSVPTDGGNIESQSLSAPTSNTIDEHELSEQRKKLDVAQKTALLQQQIWEEYQSLPAHEQSKAVEKAKTAHQEFLEKVTSTPPGMERVLLMQSLDGEMQKQLVLYKLWCSHNSVE